MCGSEAADRSRRPLRTVVALLLAALRVADEEGKGSDGSAHFASPAVVVRRQWMGGGFYGRGSVGELHKHPFLGDSSLPCTPFRTSLPLPFVLRGPTATLLESIPLSSHPRFHARRMNNPTTAQPSWTQYNARGPSGGSVIPRGESRNRVFSRFSRTAGYTSSRSSGSLKGGGGDAG